MGEWVNQIVSEMGYVGLALLTFLETVFPPIPSEVILPLGGYMAAQGFVTLPGVAAAGTLGSVVGALVLYWVGRQFSRERLVSWAERYGGWFLLTGGDVETAFDWFDRHGQAAVFVGRLAPIVRSLISIPAGASGMAMGPFLLYTALGTAIWCAALAYAGMLLGQRYTEVETVLKWATIAVAVLLVVGVLQWWVKVQRSRRARRVES